MQVEDHTLFDAKILMNFTMTKISPEECIE